MTDPTPDPTPASTPGPTPGKPIGGVQPVLPGMKQPDGRHVGRYVSDLLQSVASRDRAKETIKTLLLVVPLTLLIWVYAERSQSTEERITLSIDIESPDPQQAAMLVHGAGDDESGAPTVTLTVEGPRSRIVYVKSEIARLSREGKLKMAVPSLLGSGRDHDISVASLAAINAPFEGSGVTVRTAEPESITVKIDPIESRDVSVQLPREAAQLVTEQRFEPALVRVRGPVSVLNKVISRPDGFSAVVDLSAVAWRTPGRKTLENVPLQPTGNPLLTFTPASVNVSLYANPLQPTFTIPSMFISVQKPLNMDGKYRVEVSPIVLTNVRVIGPQDKIDLLRTDKATPRPAAVLTVTADDIGKDGRRAVRYELPAGVQAVDRPVEVDFKLIELTDSP